MKATAENKKKKEVIPKTMVVFNVKIIDEE